MRLREKLGALCALAVTLPFATASLLVSYQVSSSSRQRAVEELKREASAAHSIYRKRLEEMRATAQRLAVEVTNRALVLGSEADTDAAAIWRRLQDLLARSQNESSLDFLVVTDSTGRVIARHNDRPVPGETLLAADSKNQLAEKVISEGLQNRNTPLAAITVEKGDRLSQLGLNMRAQVTRSDGSRLDEALVIESAAPILSSGRFIGLVVIGQMLNNDYALRAGSTSIQTPLVIEIAQSLYSMQGNKAGALVALGDTVITSSVPSGESSLPSLVGARAQTGSSLGEVEDGGRSFEVSWQPLKSLDGSEPGAIGVALPASEMSGPAARTAILLLLFVVAAAGIGGAGGFLLGRELEVRVNLLRDAASRMSVGELSTQVRDSAALNEDGFMGFLRRDEITALADQIDEMRESFRQAIERLKKR